MLRPCVGDIVMLQPCGADIIMLQFLQAGYFRHFQTFIISVIVKKQNNNVADLCLLPSARSINGKIKLYLFFFLLIRIIIYFFR